MESITLRKLTSPVYTQVLSEHVSVGTGMSTEIDLTV